MEGGLPRTALIPAACCASLIPLPATDRMPWAKKVVPMVTRPVITSRATRSALSLVSNSSLRISLLTAACACAESSMVTPPIAIAPIGPSARPPVRMVAATVRRTLVMSEAHIAAVSSAAL